MKNSLAKFLPLLGVAAFCGGLVPASAETVLSKFDAENALDGQYAGWESVEPSLKSTNWTVTASGFGGAWKNLNPVVDAGEATTIELTVTIESTNVPPASVTAGPLVVLADEDGTQQVWAWYGQKAGHHVLKKKLSSPTKKQEPGSVEGLDLSKLKAFHIQVDPGPGKAAYRIKFEKLRLIAE
jgi:hypothetical protein